MFFSPHPVPARGALRDRHGRWARDAMDASRSPDERPMMRTAKACGPGALVAGAKPVGDDPASDGDTKAGLAGARTIYAVNTIAQGMPMRRSYL